MCFFCILYGLGLGTFRVVCTVLNNCLLEIVQIFIERNNRHSNFCVFVLVVTIVFRIVNMRDLGSGLPFLFEVQEGLTKSRCETLSLYQSASKINTVKDIIIMFDRNIDTKTGGTVATTTKKVFVEHEETSAHVESRAAGPQLLPVSIIRSNKVSWAV